MDFIVSVLTDKCGCFPESNAIGDNTQELLTLFKEELPFKYVNTLSGQGIQWDSQFIDKILYSMASGSLENLSSTEFRVWNDFVAFQDLKSNSATTDNIGAIGCTVPDINGNSFVVTSSGITNDLCQKPSTVIAKENQSKSLDSYFMDLYNCIEPNQWGIIQGDLVDISPCLI